MTGALARVWKELHRNNDGSDCECQKCKDLILVLRVAQAADRWEASRLSKVDPSVMEYGPALERHRGHREELKAATVAMREAKHPNPDHSSNVTDEERKLVADVMAGKKHLHGQEAALQVDEIVLRMRGAYDDQPLEGEEF